MEIKPVAFCNYCRVLEDSSTRILNWCIDSPTKTHNFYKCKPNIAHVHPCFSKVGDATCSCGCSTDGKWCKTEQRIQEISSSLQKYRGLMNSNIPVNLETHQVYKWSDELQKCILVEEHITTFNTSNTWNTPTDQVNLPIKTWNLPTDQAWKRWGNKLYEWDNKLQAYVLVSNNNLSSDKDEKSDSTESNNVSLESISIWLRNNASDEEKQKLYEILYNFGCRVFK